MQTKDLLKMNLEACMGMIMPMFEDMKDAPLTSPTPKGGNHPLWVIGHLAYSEGSLLQEMMLGESNPLAEWKEIFSNGTEPVETKACEPEREKFGGHTAHASYSFQIRIWRFAVAGRSRLLPRNKNITLPPGGSDAVAAGEGFSEVKASRLLTRHWQFIVSAGNKISPTTSTFLVKFHRAMMELIFGKAKKQGALSCH